MAAPDRSHGQDGDKVLDLPAVRDERRSSQDDHAYNEEERDGEAVLEPLEHLGHLDEEVGEFGFLGRGAPLHVVLEHVGKKRRADVYRDTTEENGHHDDPLDVLKERAKEAPVTNAVAHGSESHVSDTSEDDDDGEPDFNVSSCL